MLTVLIINPSLNFFINIIKEGGQNMLTVSNSSSDVSLLYTPTDNAPYFIIHKTIYFIDMSESIATDIIKMFEDGKMSTITNMSLQQYDIYRKIDEYKAGLKKLFDYFIYDNQWFIKNEFNIVSPNEAFHTAATEQIIASQKTITATGVKFPPNDKKFVDTNPLSEPMRGGMVITTETPIITITIAISLAKSYEEIKDTLDPKKDDAVKGTYHFYQHIQHDIIGFEMGRSIAKFYGSMTTVKDYGTGSMSIDIHEIVKEEEKYVPTTTTPTSGS